MIEEPQQLGTVIADGPTTEGLVWVRMDLDDWMLAGDEEAWRWPEIARHHPGVTVIYNPTRSAP